MFKKELKVWVSWFVFAVAIIAVYKTFDDFSGLLGVLSTIVGLLAPFIYGLVLAFLLYLPARKVEIWLRKANNGFISKKARPIGVLTALIAFLLVLVIILVLFLPSLYNNIIAFASSVPQYIDDLYKYVIENTNNAQWLNNAIAKVQEQLTFSNILSWLQASDIGSYAKGIQSFIGVVINLFIGIILAIYILMDRAALKRNFGRISRLVLKPRRAKKFSTLAARVCDVLYSFLYGQALDALFVGVTSTIGFTILQIPNASVLGLIYGIFSLIPYFGAFIGVIAVCLFTLLSGGVSKLIVVFIFIMILQQLDANIINPKIIGNSIGIKPLYVIFGATLFGGLFGVAGMLVGPPIMAILLELTQEFLTEREQIARIKEHLRLNHAEPYDPDMDIELYVKQLNEPDVAE